MNHIYDSLQKDLEQTQVTVPIHSRQGATPSTNKTKRKGKEGESPLLGILVALFLHPQCQLGLYLNFRFKKKNIVKDTLQFNQPPFRLLTSG